MIVFKCVVEWCILVCYSRPISLLSVNSKVTKGRGIVHGYVTRSFAWLHHNPPSVSTSPYFQNTYTKARCSSQRKIEQQQRFISTLFPLCTSKMISNEMFKGLQFYTPIWIFPNVFKKKKRFVPSEFSALVSKHFQSSFDGMRVSFQKKTIGRIELFADV